MAFHSVTFLFLLMIISFVLYYTVPVAWKNPVLLLSNLVFLSYGQVLFLPVLLLSLTGNYFAGLMIGGKKKGTARIFYLAATAVNLLILILLRYGKVLGSAPVGLYIYTLQVFSYESDLYRRKVRMQKDPVSFAIYASFFPVMMGGPLLTYHEVEDDLSFRRVSWGKMGDGAIRFAFGFVKAVLLSQVIKEVCTEVLTQFRTTSTITVAAAWMGAVSGMLYLYFLMSGYADMAVGIGNVYGFSLPEAYDSPLFSHSISNFFERFNGVLYRFLLTYVYQPIAGRKRRGRIGRIRKIAAILLTWMLVGAFYGNGYRHLLWGLYFAVLILVEQIVFEGGLNNLPRLFGIVFSKIFIIIPAPFIICGSVKESFSYMGKLFGIGAGGFSDSQTHVIFQSNMYIFLIFAFLCTPVLKMLTAFLTKKNAQKKNAAILGIIALLVLAILSGLTRDTMWSAAASRIGYVAGRRASGGIYQGADKYLFQDTPEVDEGVISSNVAAVTAFKKANPDKLIYSAIVPDKTVVLSDQLPSAIDATDMTNALTTIQNGLSGGSRYTDLWRVLGAHEGESLFYRTDSHWTALAAYYSFEQLKSTMGLSLENEINWTPYVVSGTFSGSLAAKSGYEASYYEPISIYTDSTGNDTHVLVSNKEAGTKTATLYDTEALSTDQMYDLYLGGDVGKLTIKTTADSSEKLLVLKDSYANCLIPFLTPYYREIIVIDTTIYKEDISSILEKKNIDEVLIVESERTFVTSDNLNTLLGTKSVEEVTAEDDETE